MAALPMSASLRQVACDISRLQERERARTKVQTLARRVVIQGSGLCGPLPFGQQGQPLSRRDSSNGAPRLLL